MFENLPLLTFRAITLLCANHSFSLPSSIRDGGKDVSIRYIIQNAPSSLLDQLVLHAEECGRKRKRNNDDLQGHCRTRRRVDDEFRVVKARSDYDSSQFLDLPTDDEMRKCYRRFYDATSNRAVQMGICGVCGREIEKWKEEMVDVELGEIPHREKLIPHEAHPAHTLYDGCLLESGAVFRGSNRQLRTTICQGCWCSLRNENTGLPPALSLANNLWIGSVPDVLNELTVPEQLLISHLYPRVFVFKLYPKKGFGGNSSTLQRGLRGTVSTYEMDLPGISSMVQGCLMPRIPSILASLISVTFVGCGPLRKDWLQNIFRVRRRMIFEALLRLKEINCKYYGRIEISNTNLDLLPEDGIPVELLCIIRQCTDEGIIDDESGGYVPTNDDEDVSHFDSANFVSSTFEEDRNDTEIDESQSDENCRVCPLLVSGSIDVDLTKLPSNELMGWGLANLWNESEEGCYMVRHGSQPVSDFGYPREANGVDPNRDNLFEKAYPCLFPYGRGGLEADRPVKISFSEHVKWALEYHDRRFRRHETFPFMCFGILQRRQALLSARLEMRRPNFERESRLMATVTQEKLRGAVQQEQEGHPISDPAVQALRRHVFAAAARVQGSNSSRVQCRSQIFSTTIMKNPASLWLTINPVDLHDPIAQVFAGADIDLDAFCAMLGPDSETRAQNIAMDPYAAAKFFNFIIHAILETLFGIQVTEYQVRNRPGIFGRVSAYYGLVETQGRGSLHLHLLLWLENALTGEEMTKKLQSAQFREKVVAFIKANLRAYVPGLESAESVKAIPREKALAYNRPPNPDDSDYVEQLTDFELRLARSEQIHTCHPRRCLLHDKHGQYRCKRRAPFELRDDDEIDEKGNWCQKRLYGYVNGWVPAILINVRCNNDGKLLTNGEDTKNVAMYSTLYAAKKQGRNYNVSAVMAKAYAYHLHRLQQSGNETYLDDVRDLQRLLLFRLVHSLNREQELAAPLVMSYLTGWGDIFRSHHYSPIYWSTFSASLMKEFSCFHTSLTEGIENATNHSVDLDVENEHQANDMVTLELNSQGCLYAKSQITDYILRGDELSDYNIVRFFTDTYESAKRADDESKRKGAGRPRHTRISYKNGHPKSSSALRVLRPSAHNNLPNFINARFPRSDDPETYDFYCASILMLLKAWRTLRTDLKEKDQSWSSALTMFLSTAPSEVHDIISGIRYLHESRKSADHDANTFSTSSADVEISEDILDDARFVSASADSNEEALAAIIRAQTSLAEDIHGRMAIELAKRAGIFAEDEHTADGSWRISGKDKAIHTANSEDLRNLAVWRSQLEMDVKKMNERNKIHSAINDSGHVELVCEEANDEGSSHPCEVMMIDEVESAASRCLPLEAIDPSSLNDEQRRAYDIVIWHLDETLAGHCPPPLRMMTYGEGGTGKSKVLQTITAAFEARRQAHILLKAAYTASAASLVDGKTTHVVGGISVSSSRFDGEKTIGTEARCKLEHFWQDFRYLAIDEMSMLSKDFFALLSRNISIGKQNEEQISFGGINIIILGDFHQFPPVARPIRDALFYRSDPEKDLVSSQIGRSIYEEFTTVVQLKQQCRTHDPVWLDFLCHVRTGTVIDDDLRMLETLVIHRKGEDLTPDFTADGWREAPLVTPRHAVRTQWNEAATRKMCQEKGRQIFVCTAEDHMNRRLLTTSEKCVLEAHRGQKRKANNRTSKDLPHQVEIAIGMRVMVTNNIETDLDITNGAQGEIVDIILHPDEPTFDNEQSRVFLKHLPSYILVKLTRTKATRLNGLGQNVIPIEPTCTTYRIKTTTEDGKTKQRTIRRTQFPMTACYAFTDYRSQGQTIFFVIVDIASPPSGALNLFNLYVALSRSSGRDTIRLLRGFDWNIFKRPHDAELLREDERLAAMDATTEEWYHRVVRS